jgi:hypothetical protein
VWTGTWTAARGTPSTACALLASTRGIVAGQARVASERAAHNLPVVSSNHTRPTTFDQHLCSGASRCTASLVAFLVAVCRFRGEIGYLAAASGPGMSRAAVFYGPNRHRDGSWGGATSRPRSARVPGSVLATSAGQMPFLGFRGLRGHFLAC